MYKGEAKSKNARIVLPNGTQFDGIGYGAKGYATGELCFNTAMTGYQEIISDPSYADQIIVFTFPHIGNVGVNREDNESQKPRARGIITRLKPTNPSNWRNAGCLDSWLKTHNIIGIYGIDTRKITRQLRELGVVNAIISHGESSEIEYEKMIQSVQKWPGLSGSDLASDVCCKTPYRWNEGQWFWPGKFKNTHGTKKIVTIDFGVKTNILRCLAESGCTIQVVPATATYEEILNHNPDGIILSNGPGDPKATGEYAIKVLRNIIDNTTIPIFGICLGHQILALALGARTLKMDCGHHGANHPVKDMSTGKVEITSMNHGFTVDRASLPVNVLETHISLFDNTNCGLELKGRNIFSVQFHPEASPGPVDSFYLFSKFVAAM
ncbi:MAG: carbamoyl phosphate synthase small subunit [Rhodobacteraceae bacterium]|nr:carbamoyl phosphate synthase small subunit [Paracoccaceae bacterium]